MLDCRHATQLVSQSLERRLDWRQRLALRVHLWMCDACTQFVRQLRLLQVAAARLSRKIENDSTLKLSPSARERIAANMASRSVQPGEAQRDPDH